MKSQHNLVFWNACGNQVFGDAAIDAVMVYSKFAIANFGMENQAVDSSLALPAFIDHALAIRQSQKPGFSSPRDRAKELGSVPKGLPRQ